MLPVKYAPTKWEEIKFQSHIIDPLKKSVIKGNPPTALLLKGGSGLGKTSISKVWMASLLCSNLDNGNPCGRCLSCEDVFSGKNLRNVYHLNGRENSGVDFYRNFLDQLQSGNTIFGSNKVVIIDESHGLSKASVDTLLTPIESPKNNNLFFVFCTTEGDKIPKTLLSRTMHFSVKSPDELEWATFIADVITKEAKVELSEEFYSEGVFKIIDASRGSVRESLNIVDKILLTEDFSLKNIEEVSGVISFDSQKKILMNLFNGKNAVAVMDIESLFRTNSVQEVYYDIFNECLAVYKVLCKKMVFINDYFTKKIRSSYGRVPVSRVEKVIEAFIQIKKNSVYEIDKNIFVYTLLSLKD